MFLTDSDTSDDQPETVAQAAPTGDEVHFLSSEDEEDDIQEQTEPKKIELLEREFFDLQKKVKELEEQQPVDGQPKVVQAAPVGSEKAHSEFNKKIAERGKIQKAKISGYVEETNKLIKNHVPFRPDFPH